MTKIKVISKCELYDGMSITFKAPCDCTAVDGLKIYYNNFSQTFSFRDANRNNLANLKKLFSEGAYVKAVLDTRNGYAYLQNADTNAYIENNLYTKEDLLTDATKSMYGLGTDATPNTVFQKLAMPHGYYGFDVTTVFSDGSPAPNIVLDGLEDLSGNTVMTDENGRCQISIAASATPAVTISGYLDVKDKSVMLASQSGSVFTPNTITLEKNTTMHTISSTSAFRTTGVSSYDITVVGGGGGGCSSTSSGAGGGGGYISTKLNVSIPTVDLSVVVGAGGKGSSAYEAGGAGGQSYVADASNTPLISANGGSGGSGATGGAGNGKGGNTNQAGSNATGYLFNDASLGIPGGGGGAGTKRNGTGNPGSWEQLSGGAPYGGAGGHSYRDTGFSWYYYGGEAGKGPGGGGGGGWGDYYGGNGAAGAVFMRARFA